MVAQEAGQEEGWLGEHKHEQSSRNLILLLQYQAHKKYRSA
jgi:hypothetical protein